MLLFAAIFWFAVGLILYAYFGYPLVLAVLGRLRPRGVTAPRTDYVPTVSILLPVHNESRVIRDKLENLLSIDYPREALEIIVISDGSTDDTPAVAGSFSEQGVRVVEVGERRGKANALNRGLEAARGEILVFTDASIMLRADALRKIVRHFQDTAVGCVSGEDHIEDGGGEGAYGRYELFLRRKESQVASIVGASGSFYAQRRDICQPFLEGMAPDFLSVLNTVEAGYRSISDGEAVGTMTSVKSPRDEYRRKVRTLVRGFAALSAKRHLLDPRRYGLFSFLLVSHKLLRWLVPFFMIAALLANAALVSVPVYQVTLALQLLGYVMAGAAFMGVPLLRDATPVRICLYFVNVNVAILAAWLTYWRGTRLEVWTPSQR